MNFSSERFKKSLILHASRLMFYDDEFGKSGAVGINNKAEKALCSLAEKAKSAPELYSQVLSELLDHEEAKIRYATGRICIQAFIHPEKARNTLIALRDVPDMFRLVILEIGFHLKCYRQEVKRRILIENPDYKEPWEMYDDIEVKKFVKGVVDFSERLLIYKDEKDNATAAGIGVHNRMVRLLAYYCESISNDPERYSAALLNLLNDENPKRRKAVAKMCLILFIHEQKAVSTLQELIKMENLADDTRESIQCAINDYLDEKNKGKRKN